ncbi:unnamed protein product [Malus baccata var. baccata]
MVRVMILVSILGFLLSIASFTLGLCNGNLNVPCIESERQTLMFKKDIDDPWNLLSSWAGEGDCCNWTGVVCDNLTGHVHELQLAGPVLSFKMVKSAPARPVVFSSGSGPVPPILGPARPVPTPNLSHLDLSRNNFKGLQIPSFLGSLKGLRYLDLSDAGFNGTIPHQLGNLSSLRYLDLSYNLEGEIPDSLRNLCKLTSFDLSSNNFRGRVSEIFESFSIPVSLGNLSGLYELVIEHNSFEGVVSEVHFTNLTRLKIFIANENSLTLKTSPDWVPPFQLVELSLSSWRLDLSELPTWLQSKKYLSALNMSNTGISGTIPTWFWNIFSYGGENYVDLSYNQLSAEVPNIVSANW